MRNHKHYVRAAEIRQARFQLFLQQFAAYERDANLEATRDRFLDAYSVWLRHHSPVTRENVIQAAEALRAIDPAFEFETPSEEDVYDA